MPEEKKASQDMQKNKGPAVIKSWYMEQYEMVVIQRNILLLGVIASFVLILVGIWFIKKMQESHTVEPFVISIEEKTGVPTVVDPIAVEQFAADEAIKKFFIMQYIRAREEYTFESHGKNKRLVRVMSNNSVNRDYYSIVRPSNENSPSQRYGNHTTVEIKLKSLIFETKNRVQVRVSVVTSGEYQRVEEKVILMEFDFKNLRLNKQQRLDNPLGFVVTLYRIADEIISQ